MDRPGRRTAMKLITGVAALLLGAIAAAASTVARDEPKTSEQTKAAPGSEDGAKDASSASRLVEELREVKEVLEARHEEDRLKIEQLEKKIEELDQRVRVTDRLREIKEEEAASKAKGATIVTSNAADGFSIRSGDGNFVLKVGGYMQVDGRFFPDNDSPANDTFLLRRIRPDFRGTLFKYVDFRLLPDFGQGTTTIFDAYVELKYFPRAALRAGKFKPGLGLERLQSATDLWFVERGLPTNLVPNRDVGFQIAGDVIKNRISYSAGVFNGTADGGSADFAAGEGREAVARVFLTPWKPNAKHPLSGLGFGIAGSTGDQSHGALPTVRSASQNTLFSYSSGVIAAGDRNRFSPQGYYFWGPFGVLGEYVRSQQKFRLGQGPVVELGQSAWQVAAALVVTGEKKSYQGITPKKNFDPHSHGWGALELDFRTGQFDADPAAFRNGLATLTKSAKQAREWAGGANWYLNRSVKIMVDYAQTSFSGGAATGDRPDEKVVLSRFQVAF